MDIVLKVVQDALFAAIAAIGFAAISNPPKVAFKYCALISAVGHALRFTLVTLLGLHVVWGSSISAFVIGCMAVFSARKVKCPPETFAYPSLLPMIPGMYAYRSLQAFLMVLGQKDESAFSHYAYLLQYNGTTCAFIIFAMVLGQMIPIFLFKNRSFSATRN
jgi:uncharacterized membrane protein YjjB (DUF3815 family)